ncbi:pyridoxamine 5'-phosphate oxidase [Nocardioides seonyuensis]|uniref:Pyridoxamine 5'-phosphate oxidase n=1 Tax=Nocardioides seonyuensis TaxID=2518371 RepID=A0A4P7ID12_9ACTN|nr:pyridoxamine 5'-phosphate oxidase family protein [Nocardioides seonyuensis]QBX55009.1 pyridoxamine 5'-phosphate oxidase [Nocardioides seonyuensis]
MPDQDPRELVAEIMEKTRIAVLTYVDDVGRLVSVPLGTQDFDDPGTVWFITELDTDKVAAIRQRPAVNVAYASDKGWVSLAGNAEVSEDRAKLEELWDPSVSAFMKGDAQDPNNGLIKVTADTAEYWENPGKAAMVVKLVKGLVSDDKAEDEDDDSSGVVQL